MKKLNFIILLFFSLSLLGQNNYSTYILKTTRSFSTNKLKNYLKLEDNAKLEIIFEELNLYALTIPNTDTKQLTRISKSDIVEYVEADQKLEYRKVPNDKFYEKQYGLEQIKATKVWESNTGGLTGNGDTIVIAVLDLGLEIAHDDLQGNIWRNKGEIPNDGIDNDYNGYIDDYLGVDLVNKNDNHRTHYHGTSVAGIIGAKGNNNIGIAGVNWNIKILPITNVGTVSQVLKGYDYVYKERKKFNDSNGKEGSLIVATNLSAGIKNGFPEDKKEFRDWCTVYDKLGKLGILNITSAVNDPVNVEEVGDMPTLCQSEYLIPVTSTNKDDVFDSDRSFGANSIDIAAPGREIYTISVENGYKSKFTGNSAAAPFVAGAIGLLYTVPCKGFTDKLKANPDELSLKIKDYLMKFGDEKSSLKNKTVSGARLNVYNTYLELSDLCSGVPTGDFGIITITPNPSFDENVSIEYNTNDFDEHQIRIFDRIGRLVYDKTFTPNIFGKRELVVNVSGYATGIYYATLYLKKKKSTRAFFVY